MNHIIYFIMAYRIIPNHFAIKYVDDEFDSSIKLHSVTLDRCNFRCGFCNFSNREKADFKEYSPSEFEERIKELIPVSKYFKFTGGEPTLNKYLERDLKIVKDHGGIIFLDSNGSLPQKLEKLMEQNLIDVLGISFKGTTCELAKKTANIKNPKFTWDNVLESIKIADQHGIKIIVTLVVYRGIPLENINELAKLISQYKGVRLKVNTIITVNHQDGRQYEKYSENELLEYMKQFVNNHNEWRNRVTLVNSDAATSDNDAVILL